MAKVLLFSVFDTKSGAYAAPFVSPSRGSAVRAFSDACGDDNLPFKKHPGDYRLFLLAEFDDNSGSILPIQPDPIIGADEFS